MLIHTSIRTSNLEKSINFYEKFLGLKLLEKKKIPQNNAEIAFLRDPLEKGAVLELTFYKNQKKFLQAEYEDRLFDHLAFKIENLTKKLKRMKAAKITITDEPFKLNPNGPFIAFIEDPDGTLIELIEKK
jgi:lactoylglutathione lyase